MQSIVDVAPSGRGWVTPILFRLLVAALPITAGWPAIASAQAVLEISSPASGAPGRTMTVVVTSPAHVTFTTSA